MITIIDYGVGNINAFINVYKRLNISTKIARTVEDLEDAQKLILPGVGHFDHAMSEFIKSGMREKIDDLVLVKKIPVLGICVGMQMMGNCSDEGKLDGLKWIDTVTKKFNINEMGTFTQLPHMGWNDLHVNTFNPLFNGLEKNAIFYFLHSYFFECNNSEDIVAYTEYGTKFTCAANHKNIFGIQFHPEKSHHYGEILLNNFANL